MDIIILGLIFVYTIISFIETKRKGDIFNPLLLFVFPLFFSILLYNIFYKKIHMVSDKTLGLFFLGVTFFIIGYGISNKFFYNKEKVIDENNKSIKVNQIFLYACLLVGLASVIFTLKYTMELGLISNNLSTTFFSNVRENYIDDDSIPFLVKYGKYLLLFSTCVFWYRHQIGKPLISNKKMYFLIIVCFVNSILLLARTDLFITILPILCIYINCNAKLEFKSKKKYRKITIILIILFVVNIILGVVRSGNGFDFEIFNDPNFFIYKYLGYPLVAFDIWIVDQPFSSSGFVTLELLEKFFIKIDLIVTPIINAAPRGKFNVYSFLFSPYVDFGTIGIVIYTFFIGLFCGWIYYKAKSEQGYWFIFYSIYTYAIFMAFFHWQFTIITYFYLMIFILFVSCTNTYIWNKSKNTDDD